MCVWGEEGEGRKSECGCDCLGVGVIEWVDVGLIAWVRKGVCEWDSLDCCYKVCVCVGRGEGDGREECVCGVTV